MKPGSLVFSMLFIVLISYGQSYNISYVASITSPMGIALDGSGDIYIAGYNTNQIFKINSYGTITSIAGNGTMGYSGDGGPATSASLWFPTFVAVDGSGNIYFSDSYNNVIRKINSAGIISTIAGTAGSTGYSGDGGPATLAQLNSPQGMAISGTNLYIADGSNHVIRLINSVGTISTLAGNHISGFSGDGGPATGAELSDPHGISVDGSGNLFIADAANNRIRKVNSSGLISTIAGNGSAGFSGDGGPATLAELNNPFSIVTNTSGNLFVADYGNSVVREIGATGNINTIAGNGSYGYSGDGGPSTIAQLSNPSSIAVDVYNDVYISDFYNNKIRMLSSPDLTAAGIISGPDSVCEGSSIFLTDTLSGGWWNSSNTSVASVSLSGSVTGLSTGVATISYILGSQISTKPVRVDPPLSEVAIMGFRWLCPISSKDSESILIGYPGGGIWSDESPAIISLTPTVTSDSVYVKGLVSDMFGIVRYVFSGACGTTEVSAGFTILTPWQCDSILMVNSIFNKKEDDVIVYPNPTNGNLTISASNSGKFIIYGLLGNQVSEYVVTDRPTDIQLPKAIPSGIYIGKYTANDGKKNQQVRLIVVQ